MSYIYDNNGNLIDDGNNTYEYDYGNRLLRVTRNSDNVILGEYKYDALGRRIEKQVSGVGTIYIYDDIEDKIIEEHYNNFTKVYIYGNDMNEFISMEYNGQTYYYHSDSLGSIVALTDVSGSIIEQYSYDAYGRPNASSVIGNPYMFTGRRLDKETGLYYYRARYYSAAMGRFLQRDPLGYFDSMNLYEYVASNPINRIDPTGLSWSITGGWFAAKKLRLAANWGKNGYPLSAELLEFSLNNPTFAGLYYFTNSYSKIKNSKKYQTARDNELEKLCCTFKTQGSFSVYYAGGDLGYSVGHVKFNVTNIRCSKNSATFHAHADDPYDFKAQYGWTLGRFKKWLITLWAEQAIEGGYMSDKFKVVYDFEDTATFK